MTHGNIPARLLLIAGFLLIQGGAWKMAADAEGTSPIPARFQNMSLSPALGDLQIKGLARAQFIGNTNSIEGAQTNSFSVFDLKHNGFMLNQLELVFKSENEVYTDGRIGYRFDVGGGRTAQVIAYYPDNAALGANGKLVTGTAGVYARPKVTLEQAYLTYGTTYQGKQIDFKAGRFVTWQGNEVIPDIENINWLPSNSYLFVYAIPFTHTGAGATYHYSDQLTFGYCAIQGWDTIKDNNSAWSHMGHINYVVSPQLTLYGNVTHGPEQDTNNINDRTVWNGVLTYVYNDKTTFVVDYANGKEKHPAAATKNGTARWKAYAVYLKRALNEKTDAVLRYELFKDPDGYRTATGVPAAGVRDLELQGLTAGVSHKINDNWIFRGDARHSWAKNRSIFVDNASPNGLSNDQNIFQLDVIYRF